MTLPKQPGRRLRDLLVHARPRGAADRRARRLRVHELHRAEREPRCHPTTSASCNLASTRSGPGLAARPSRPACATPTPPSSRPSRSPRSHRPATPPRCAPPAHRPTGSPKPPRPSSACASPPATARPHQNSQHTGGRSLAATHRVRRPQRRRDRLPRIPGGRVARRARNFEAAAGAEPAHRGPPVAA